MRTEPGSFQWCPVTWPEAMGTNWNTGGSLWTSGNTFSLWGWWSTGTGCPGRLWSLHPWRYSKAIWTWSWAMRSGHPCLSRGFGPGALQRSPPTSAALWACAYFTHWVWWSAGCFVSVRLSKCFKAVSQAVTSSTQAPKFGACWKPPQKREPCKKKIDYSGTWHILLCPRENYWKRSLIQFIFDPL